MCEISVIVPVYNAETSLVKCLNSLVGQKGIDFEIILVDDGSTDGSGDICDQYAQDIKNIIACHQKNGGVSSARNHGLSMAKGKYIIFVDSDDQVEPDYLKTLSSVIEHEHTDMVIAGYKIKSKNNVESVYMEHKQYCFEEFSTFEKLSSKMMLATPWAKLFVKEKIRDEFKTNINLGEDVCFVLSYMCNIDSISIINNTNYIYNVYDNMNSLSKKYHDNLEEVVCEVDKVKCKLFKEKYPDNVRAISFRKESLVSDVLLMISKLCKADLDVAALRMNIEKMFDYLKKENCITKSQNKKLILIFWFYKLHLLGMLKLIYRMKDNK